LELLETPQELILDDLEFGFKPIPNFNEWDWTLENQKTINNGLRQRGKISGLGKLEATHENSM
jgi:hypothetical protein